MKILPFIFAFILFSTAFLGFAVQPMLGKMLLPIVGGSPSGWIVAMTFFQLALLAGYGASWILGRFNPWIHAIALLLLYVAGCYFLPLHLPEITDEKNIAFQVIKALACTVFLPYAALTATTAALQRVFSATKHQTASDPYYLFVASNIGSFAGLIAYPFVFEPLYGLGFQADLWGKAYLIIAVLVLCTVIFAHFFKTPAKPDEDIKAVTATSPKQLFYWFALAFIPCSLSMGVTTLITTDMAGVPLFWIVPLGLYLLTFVLAFAKKQFKSMKKLESWHLNMVGFLMAVFAMNLQVSAFGNFFTFILGVLVLLEVFFSAAWSCHAKLAQSRPPVDRLPLYYFIIALGGAAAGVFHVFILPFVLDRVIEFQVVMLLSLLVLNQFRHPQKNPRVAKLEKFYWPMAIVCIAAVLAMYGMRHFMMSNDFYYIFVIVFLSSLLFVSSRIRPLLLIGSIILCCGYFATYSGNVISSGRNFFGAWAAYDTSTGEKNIRYFRHGNTIHGLEVQDKNDKINRYNSSYYDHEGPIEDVIDIVKPKTWAVIGLGAGQLACFQPKLVTDFYEIDQDVEKVARRDFSYLAECPPRDVIIGDGRIMFKNMNRKYDLLLIDAFTSDGIPIHLITKEAIATYLSQLTPGGLIIFHVSNRYIDLTHPLAAVAKANGLTSFDKFHTPDAKKYPLVNISRWVAIPTDAKAAKPLEAKGWIKTIPSEKLWTDDKSSPMDAIAFSPKVH